VAQQGDAPPRTRDADVPHRGLGVPADWSLIGRVTRGVGHWQTLL
jgi:hypothetical protein